MLAREEFACHHLRSIEALTKLQHKANENGMELFVAGGAIRNLLMEVPTINDYDTFLFARDPELVRRNTEKCLKYYQANPGLLKITFMEKIVSLHFDKEESFSWKGKVKDLTGKEFDINFRPSILLAEFQQFIVASDCSLGTPLQGSSIYLTFVLSQPSIDAYVQNFEFHINAIWWDAQSNQIFYSKNALECLQKRILTTLKKQNKIVEEKASLNPDNFPDQLETFRIIQFPSDYLRVLNFCTYLNLVDKTNMRSCLRVIADWTRKNKIEKDKKIGEYLAKKVICARKNLEMLKLIQEDKAQHLCFNQEFMEKNKILDYLPFPHHQQFIEMLYANWNETYRPGEKDCA